MTDSIDLDDIETSGSAEDSDDDSNYGDWLWRGEGDPEDEPAPSWAGSPDPDDESDEEASTTANTASPVASELGEEPAGSGADAATETDDHEADSTSSGDSDESEERQPIPGVPRTTDGPVGVPESQGGAGGGSSSQGDDGPSSGTETGGSQRTTNHGEATDPDDMTLAFTYEAINRLEDPQFAVASARSWSDWLGIVGKVSTPAIRKFQRDQGIDLDFFGGSETGAAERLADITPDSMFYADRMVLVGAQGDERIAEAADWEFIPLETAAEKAEWEIEHEN